MHISSLENWTTQKPQGMLLIREMPNFLRRSVLASTAALKPAMRAHGEYFHAAVSGTSLTRMAASSRPKALFAVPSYRMSKIGSDGSDSDFAPKAKKAPTPSSDRDVQSEIKEVCRDGCPGDVLIVTPHLVADGFEPQSCPLHEGLSQSQASFQLACSLCFRQHRLARELCAVMFSSSVLMSNVVFGCQQFTPRGICAGNSRLPDVRFQQPRSANLGPPLGDVRRVQRA